MGHWSLVLDNQQPNGRTSTRSVTKSAVRASPPTDNQQPNGRTSRLGRENATCGTWGDPKTAVADLPRARSDPGGIFPTADASAPTPTNQQPTPNTQHPTPNNQPTTNN
ncbi:MAG: hypothetical protein ACHBN1_09190 [Heteroscytonema crispum UTEX LB 1556]